MQYYSFHIGDYTTATVHLTALEDLAYRRLLDFYYMKESPIPTDIPWVSRRLRLDENDVKNVLNEFFEQTPEGWKNKRCDADIEAFHTHIEKQRANGKKGGRPRKKPKQNPKKPTANPPKSDGVPTVKPPSTHNPEPKTQKPNIEIYREFDHLSLSVPEFEHLVSEGWTKDQLDDIMDDIENFAGNTKYSSLKLTARNWLKRRKKDEDEKLKQLDIDLSGPEWQVMK